MLLFDLKAKTFMENGWLLCWCFFCLTAHFGRVLPCRTKAAFVVCAGAMMNMNMNESCYSLVAVMVVGLRLGQSQTLLCANFPILGQTHLSSVCLEGFVSKG